jgi:hypothetical protein
VYLNDFETGFDSLSEGMTRSVPVTAGQASNRSSARPAISVMPVNTTLAERLSANPLMATDIIAAAIQALKAIIISHRQ